MEKEWMIKLKSHLVATYGEQYAERLMKHLAFVETYTEYGAPGHMDFVLINALVEVLNKEDE